MAKAFFNTKQTNQCCGAGVTELRGATESLVNLDMTVSASSGNVTMTLTGPSTVWFGVGFYAQTMDDAPYTIIVDGTGAVSEVHRKPTGSWMLYARVLSFILWHQQWIYCIIIRSMHGFLLLSFIPARIVQIVICARLCRESNVSCTTNSISPPPDDSCAIVVALDSFRKEALHRI